MAIRPIVKFPDNFLRQPTRDVTVFDEELHRFLEDMTETMYAANGAGLAAIQVGDPRRIFIIEGTIASGDDDAVDPESPENEGKEMERGDLPPVAFINPKIEWLSDDTETTDEGCLSFPGIYVPIKRSFRARVRAFDANGQEFVVEAEALFARALQHENDHLLNKLLIDYVGPLKKQIIRRRLERDARAEAAELASE